MKKNITCMLVAIATIALFPFGQSIAQNAGKSKIYTIEEIIEKAPSLVGQTVQIKGVAQHVCATSGRKLFLATPDGKMTFRVNAGKNITKFDKKVLKQNVIATGVVFETRTKMEALNKQEAAAIAAEKAKAEPEHCSSEAKAQGEDVKATAVQRVQTLKTKLQEQIDKGGKDYLSFYSMNNCNEYTISK